MNERETEIDPVMQTRMLEADTVERWSSALGANDASGVDQLVQQGQALRSSASSRWIGAADSKRSPELQGEVQSSTPPVSEALADDRMAVRELARGRRLLSYRPITPRG